MDKDESILDFIYVLAMREATQREAYPGEKAWLTKEKEFPNMKRIKEELYCFIKNVFNGKFNSQNDYDAIFYKLAKDICEKINENKQKENENFTFGNAQKFINMSLKFLYITSYMDSKRKAHFEYCHCPMDSKLLNHVWEDELVQSELKKRGWSKTAFTKPWSKEKLEDNKRYVAFQYAVKELSKDMGCSTLEYDYYAWQKEGEF